MQLDTNNIIDSFKSNNFIKLISDFVLNNTNNIIWFIFLIIFVFFLIYSLIFIYHWLKYETASSTIWLAMIVYFSVSFICLVLMYLSAIIIS